MINEDALEELVIEANEKAGHAIIKYLGKDLEGAMEDLKNLYKILKPIFEEKTPATESPDE